MKKVSPRELARSVAVVGREYEKRFELLRTIIITLLIIILSLSYGFAIYEYENSISFFLKIFSLSIMFIIMTLLMPNYKIGINQAMQYSIYIFIFPIFGYYIRSGFDMNFWVFFLASLLVVAYIILVRLMYKFNHYLIIRQHKKYMRK